MKYSTIIGGLIGIYMLSGCNKPEVITFKDNSTVQKANKTTWTATADSETPDGWENTGKASAVIDGNISTYWHTMYGVTPAITYPHWLLIDMKEKKNIISIDIVNRQAGTPNGSGMKKFRLELSNDGTVFTSAGEFAFAVTNAPQSYPVSSATAYRYLKITALEPQVAGTAHTFLAEVDVFVTK